MVGQGSAGSSLYCPRGSWSAALPGQQSRGSVPWGGKANTRPTLPISPWASLQRGKAESVHLSVLTWPWACIRVRGPLGCRPTQPSTWQRKVPSLGCPTWEDTRVPRGPRPFTLPSRPAGGSAAQVGLGALEGSPAAPRSPQVPANGLTGHLQDNHGRVQHAQRLMAEMYRVMMSQVFTPAVGTQETPSNTVTRRQTPQPGGLQAPTATAPPDPGSEAPPLNPYSKSGALLTGRAEPAPQGRQKSFLTPPRLCLGGACSVSRVSLEGVLLLRSGLSSPGST